MADDKPKTVKVEALKYHTYEGQEYQVGDTYDYPEEYADGLAANGFAVRVDRAQVAKQAEKDAAKSKARPTAIKPMGLDTKAPRKSVKNLKVRNRKA